MSKPLIFLTGFLGAGKTTLLRSLLLQLRAHGRSADVILNDFANAELDAATLSEGVASLSPIAASCACCESLDELMELCIAASRSCGDAVLIELNGTADPLALLEAFTLLERQIPFHPRLQVGLVDARHWDARGEFGPLEQRQLETASHWILSHREAPGIDQARLDAVDESVHRVNPHATRLLPRQLAAALIAEIDRPTTPDRTESTDHDHDHRHDHAHRLSHQFTGCQIRLSGRLSRQRVTAFLEALPDSVVRAKALVKLTNPPGSRWLFERTGRHPIPEPLEVTEFPNVSAAVVCIGPRLDPGALRELATRHFGAAALN